MTSLELFMFLPPRMAAACRLFLYRYRFLRSGVASRMGLLPSARPNLRWETKAAF